MKNKYKCPVCKISLEKTANELIRCCPEKEVYVDFVDATVKYSHATIYEDNGTKVSSIEIPPYSVTIIEAKGLSQTRICKMSANDMDYNKPQCKFGEWTVAKESLLVLPRAIDCKWNDSKEVEKMVKTFLLFS